MDPVDHSDPIAPNDPAWLASPAAEVVLDRAGALVAAHPDDPLSVGATLRREHPGLTPARRRPCSSRPTCVGSPTGDTGWRPTICC